jgi:hypothetical protein
MSAELDRLYDLLPGVIRLNDAAEGWPLRDLLRVIAEQRDLLEDDMRRMYANLFIETCEPWAIAYLGDLVGFRPLAGPAGSLGGRSPYAAPRREVADTLALRRRKGTLGLLEDLALATAGWPLRARERAGAPVVDIELYRLRSYPITRGRPLYVPGGAGRYTFSILGNDTQLYVRPTAPDQPFVAAATYQLPVPILRDDLRQHLDELYGAARSICIFENGRPVAPERLVVTNLADWRIDRADIEAWRVGSPQGEDWVAIDPELGRFMLYERAAAATISVSYRYGFSADIGGGEYERPATDSDLAASLFRRGHLFDDGVPLLRRLLTDEAPFTAFVREQLDPLVLQAATGATIAETLRQELNRVLLAAPLALGPIDDLTLDTAARQLLAADPRGPRMVRLNRLLLEAAFPGDIARSYAVYRVSPASSVEAGLGRRRERRPEVQRVRRNVGANARGAQINAFHNEPRPPRFAVIELVDSWLYADPVRIYVSAGQTLVLRAADGCRPAIGLPDDDEDIDDLVITCEDGARVVLDGLLIVGRGVRIAGRPAEVIIRHCTLVPGWSIDHACEPRHADKPSLILSDVPVEVAEVPPEPAAPLPRLTVRIEHSIVGSILVQRDEVRADPLELHVTESIIDAAAEGYALSGPAVQYDQQIDEEESMGAAEGEEGSAAPAEPRFAPAILDIARSTVIGPVRTHAIERAENAIFLQPVTVARAQPGCMRFCSVPADSHTPRRYACQPDLVMQAAGETTPGPEAARVAPRFMDPSLRYGAPNYCRLADGDPPRCADEILRGADDESEMGVYHDLYQAQRRANLEARLAEFLPLGWSIAVRYSS